MLLSVYEKAEGALLLVPVWVSGNFLPQTRASAGGVNRPEGEPERLFVCCSDELRCSSCVACYRQPRCLLCTTKEERVKCSQTQNPTGGPVGGVAIHMHAAHPDRLSLAAAVICSSVGWGSTSYLKRRSCTIFRVLETRRVIWWVN